MEGIGKGRIKREREICDTKLNATKYMPALSAPVLHVVT